MAHEKIMMRILLSSQSDLEKERALITSMWIKSIPRIMKHLMVVLI